MILKKIYSKYRKEGIFGIFCEIRNRVAPAKLKNLGEIKPYFLNKKGLEIGGPSKIFQPSGNIPIYSLPDCLDNCNFSKETLWEGVIKEGETFIFDKNKAPGKQFCSEASQLAEIMNDTYDFLLSSHCIEHLANPVKGLFEWKRVLKTSGIMVLVVPHREGTFDHMRPVTDFDHILQDYENNKGEDDLTHIDEILALHDHERDPGGLDRDQFEERSRNNFQNRALHHHVFDTRLAVSLVDYIGMRVVSVEHFYPYHIVIISIKPPTDESVDNSSFGLTGSHPVIIPFLTDTKSRRHAAASISFGGKPPLALFARS